MAGVIRQAITMERRGLRREVVADCRDSVEKIARDDKKQGVGYVELEAILRVDIREKIDHPE